MSEDVETAKRLWAHLQGLIRDAGWSFKNIRQFQNNYVGLAYFDKKLVVIAREFNNEPLSYVHRLAILAHEYAHIDQSLRGVFNTVRDCDYDHPQFMHLAMRMEQCADNYAIRLLASHGLYDHGLTTDLQPTDLIWYPYWKRYHENKS